MEPKCATFPASIDPTGRRGHAIELKIRRNTETEHEALEQIDRYLDSAGLQEGWLVLFDLRESVSWQEKLFVRENALSYLSGSPHICPANEHRASILHPTIGICVP